jgi:hypothetical protein
LYRQKINQLFVCFFVENLHDTHKINDMKSLAEYISERGDDECAALFDCTLITVASWRRGVRVPHPKTAARIIDVCGGELTMESIYNRPTSRLAKKRKKRTTTNPAILAGMPTHGPGT